MHDLACVFSFSTNFSVDTEDTLNLLFSLVLLQVLFKLQLSGACHVIQIEKVLCHLSMTQDDFLNMCIVAGCNFHQNVRGVGIHTAQKLVTKEDFLAVLQKNKNAPADYTDGFQRAKAVFHHQTILNPALMATPPLTPWPEPTSAEAFLNSCGEYPMILKYFSLIPTPNNFYGGVSCMNV